MPSSPSSPRAWHSTRCAWRSGRRTTASSTRSGSAYALLERVREAGGTVLTGVRVERLLSRSGRVAGVATSHGDVAAGAVLLATNAWTPFLAPHLAANLTPIQETVLRHRDAPVLDRPPRVRDEPVHRVLAPDAHRGGRHRRLRASPTSRWASARTRRASDRPCRHGWRPWWRASIHGSPMPASSAAGRASSTSPRSRSRWPARSPPRTGRRCRAPSWWPASWATGTRTPPSLAGSWRSSSRTARHAPCRSIRSTRAATSPARTSRPGWDPFRGTAPNPR